MSASRPSLDAATASTGRRRAALIYVPGGGVAAPDESLEVVSRPIAAELDRSAADPRATFAVQVDARPETFSETLRTYVSTITRTDGPVSEPILDIYAFDYYRTLRGRYLDAPLPLQSLRVLGHRPVPPQPRACDRRPQRSGKTAMEWVQIMLGLLIFAALAAYMAVLIVAVFDTVTQLPELRRWSNLVPPWGTKGRPRPRRDTEAQASMTAAQALTVFAAAFGMFFPRFRTELTRGAAWPGP